MNLSHLKLFIFEKPKVEDEVGKKLVFLNFAFLKKFSTGEAKRVSLPPRLIWVSEHKDIHQQVKDHLEAIIPEEDDGAKLWNLNADFMTILGREGDDTVDDDSGPYTLEFFRG